MNYTFLVIITACLIGCGAKRYTQEELNKYCKKCLKDSSTGAVFPHPSRCNVYLNCQILLNGFLAHVMNCPAGFAFDNDSLNCLPNHYCSKPCDKGDKYGHTSECGKYFVCQTGTFSTDAVYQSCSALHRFDEAQQKCIPDGNCNPPADCSHRKAGNTESEYIETISGNSNVVSCASGLVFSKANCGCVKPDSCPHLIAHEKNETLYYEIIKTLKKCAKGYVFKKEECACIKLKTCSDEFKLSSESGKYWRLVHGSWTLLPCAPTTSFNLTTCSCSDRIQGTTSKPGDGCNRINVKLESNVKDSYNSYVENIGVTIVDQKGYFGGAHYFVMARTSNVQLVSKVEIRLSFKLSSNQLGNTVALLGNARCEKDATIAIYIENAKSSPKLVVYMVVGASKTVEKLEADVAIDTWYNVKVVKEDTKATLYVNNVKKGDLNSAGQIKKSQCALAAGNMYKMFNFIGYMRNVFIKWCP